MPSARGQSKALIFKLIPRAKGTSLLLDVQSFKCRGAIHRVCITWSIRIADHPGADAIRRVPTSLRRFARMSTHFRPDGASDQDAGLAVTPYTAGVRGFTTASRQGLRQEADLPPRPDGFFILDAKPAKKFSAPVMVVRCESFSSRPTRPRPDGAQTPRTRADGSLNPLCGR